MVNQNQSPADGFPGIIKDFTYTVDYIDKNRQSVSTTLLFKYLLDAFNVGYSYGKNDAYKAVSKLRGSIKTGGKHERLCKMQI